MRVSCTLNRVPHKQNYWLGRVIKWRSFIRWERSFIPIKLLWLSYLVCSLGNCVMKLCIETGLIRPVSVGVSPECHAHLLERHVSKTVLFAWNEEEREGSSFTMVKLCWRCFSRGETWWNPHWGLNRFTILHEIQSFCSN